MGCVALDGEELGQVDQAVESQNALSENRLSMNRLSMNRLSMNRLSMNRLSMNRLSMNGLADTAEGRELLSYVIRCALPAGLDFAVVDDNNAVLYTFPGLIGLAPEWEDAPLTLTGQRWVSGCLMAHVNAFGVSVPISLRGGHAALATTYQERSQFDKKEGGFYGNVFEDTDGDGLADLQVFACQGHSNSSDGFDLRVCAEVGGPCGFSVVGCEEPDPDAKWACDLRSSGSGAHFLRCYTKGRSSSSGFPGSAVPYAEIITSYIHD